MCKRGLFLTKVDDFFAWLNVHLDTLIEKTSYHVIEIGSKNWKSQIC